MSNISLLTCLNTFDSTNPDCKFLHAYLDVIQHPEKCLPNFPQVFNEVISLSTADQVVEGQTAGGTKHTKCITIFVFFQTVELKKNCFLPTMYMTIFSKMFTGVINNKTMDFNATVAPRPEKNVFISGKDEKALLYLDSRTLQVLLVRLEMTSCRISFRYLSTCNLRSKYSL